MSFNDKDNEISSCDINEQSNVDELKLISRTLPISQLKDKIYESTRQKAITNLINYMRQSQSQDFIVIRCLERLLEKSRPYNIYKHIENFNDKENLYECTN